MSVAPTPANTPHVTPADYIIIDVAETNYAVQGMSTLTLAPSVDKALREKLSQPHQQTMKPRTPGSGNTTNLSSALEAMNSQFSSL